MTSRFTGDVLPKTCEELRALPKRDDICYACFNGKFCDASGETCIQLNQCTLNGSQQCGFLQSCQEWPELSEHENSYQQVVTRCKTDPLRVCMFVIGCVTCVLFCVLVFQFLHAGFWSDAPVDSAASAAKNTLA